MATPIFICGAECGLVVAGTAPPSGTAPHWSAVSGTPTVVTSGPTVMRSARCFDNPSGGMGLTHTFASAIASGGTFVGRFYLWIDNLNVISSEPIFTTTGSGSVGTIDILRSAGGVYTLRNTVAGVPKSNEVTVASGRWLRIDVKIVHANPMTADFKVDGVAATQVSQAATAGTCTGFTIGSPGGASEHYYFDDIMASGTSGDYPLAAGSVYGLYPSGDGVHSYSATTDFLDGGTAQAALNAAGSEVDTWLSLRSKADGCLSGTVDNSNFVTNATGGTNEWLRWLAENLPADAASVNGVAHVSTHHAASATSNNQALFAVDVSAGGASPSAASKEITVLGTAAAGVWATGIDLSETTIVTVYKCAAVGETTGAWTVANVNDLGWMWGSTDVNPDAYIDGVCFEVDYVSNGASGMPYPVAAVATINNPTGGAAGVPTTVLPTVTRSNPTGGITVTPTTDVLTLLAQALTGGAGGVSITDVLTLLAQTPSGGITVTAVTDVLTLLALAAGGGVAMTPTTVVLTLTAPDALGEATGGGGATADPVTVVATVLAQAPTGGASATPTTDAITVLSQTPTGDVSVTPVTDVMTVLAQTLTGSASGTPVTDVLSLLVQAITGSVTATPTALVVTVEDQAPTGGATGTPTTVVILLAAQTPDAGGSTTATPITTVLTLLAQTPTGGAAATPTTDVLTVEDQNPSAGASGIPTTHVLTFVVNDPVAGASATATPITDVLGVFAQDLTGDAGGVPITDVLDLLVQAIEGGAGGTPDPNVLTIVTLTISALPPILPLEGHVAITVSVARVAVTSETAGRSHVKNTKDGKVRISVG